jgi:hypothetical protein
MTLMPTVGWTGYAAWVRSPRPSYHRLPRSRSAAGLGAKPAYACLDASNAITAPRPMMSCATTISGRGKRIARANVPSRNTIAMAVIERDIQCP